MSPKSKNRGSVSNQPKIDPGVSRMLERQRKLEAYDDLRVQRAGLVGILLGIGLAALWRLVQ